MFDDITFDLGDRYFKHDFVAIAHDDGVDDLAALTDRVGGAGADKSHGDIVSLLRFGLVRRGAGEDDAIADAFDGDVGIRNHLPDRGANAVEVARDREVEASHLPAFRIEEEDVGLAHFDADDVGAPRRPNDGVGDLGIGDQYVLNVARKIDDDRFADAERHRVRADVACGDVNGSCVGGALIAISPATQAVCGMSHDPTIRTARAIARIDVQVAMVQFLRTVQWGVAANALTP